MSALFPVPVDLLVQCAIDDGADYHDRLFGWAGGQYDDETRVLTLWFDPEEHENDPGVPVAEFTETKYRFRLIDE